MLAVIFSVYINNKIRLRYSWKIDTKSLYYSAKLNETMQQPRLAFSSNYCFYSWLSLWNMTWGGDKKELLYSVDKK